MKFFKAPLLVLLGLLTTVSAAKANRCENLFPMRHQGVRISKSIDLESPASIRLTESKNFDTPETQAIKIVRQALVSPSFVLNDKNFISKDEMTIGYTIDNGYSLNVVYKSDSRATKKFNINEIHLITPTNYKVKLSDSLFKEDRFELNQNEFDVNNYFPLGTKIEANIPFFIEGKTLDVLDKYNTYFGLFKKEELKKVFSNPSANAIQSLLSIRRAKDVFHKILVKQPYKMVIGVAISFSVLTYNKTTTVTPAKPVTNKTELAENKKNSVQFKESVKDPKSGNIIHYEVAAKEYNDSKRIDYQVEPVSDSLFNELERSGLED